MAETLNFLAITNNLGQRLVHVDSESADWSALSGGNGALWAVSHHHSVPVP